MGGESSEDLRRALHRLLDEPGAEAAGADSDALGSAVHQRADGLEVRSKNALRLVVGMADVIPGLMPLPAKIACVRHDGDSFPLPSALVVYERSVCYHTRAQPNKPNRR